MVLLVGGTYVVTCVHFIEFFILIFYFDLFHRHFVACTCISI